MTKQHRSPASVDQSLAEHLAPLTIAEIDALSNRGLAELMSATVEEVAAEPWTWREAAKAATDEYAERLTAAVKSGRATVMTDPTAIRRRLGGRPRVGGEAGEGPSSQVRVRVTKRTRAALESIAASQGRRLSEVTREALDDYVAHHGS